MSITFAAEFLRILPAIQIRRTGKSTDFQPTGQHSGIFSSCQLPALHGGVFAKIRANLPVSRVLQNLDEQEQGPLTPPLVQGYGSGTAATLPSPE